MIKKPERKSKAKLKKKCIQCGKEFQVSPWRMNIAKYCSVGCYYLYKKEHRSLKSYDKERICLGCGENFHPTQWYQKYCTRKCFLDSVKKGKQKICPACGKKFTQARKAQKYCSRKCGEPYRKDNKAFKKGYLDILWAEVVKCQAGLKCEYCGKTERLNSHHIFSRSRLSTRWDVDNGICLCASHHILSTFSAHKAPIDFIEWIREKRGEEWYERLRLKAKMIKKYNRSELRELVQHFKEEIEKCAV